MRSTSGSLRPVLVAALAALGLAAACADYDPPPEVRLDSPPGGAFRVGDELTLRFSEPVDPATLSIRIWPSGRDLEGQIPAATIPLLDDCRAVDAPCGDANVVLAEDGLSATIELARDSLGAAGVPLILEVGGQLADAEGTVRDLPAFFDVIFRPAREPNTEPVMFDDGVYIVVAEIKEPLPAVISLITDIEINEAGDVALAAAEGDEIGDAPRNTRDPSQLEVDDGPDGFAVFTWGFVQLSGGRRFLESEPIEVFLSLGGLIVVIHDIRISGEIVRDDALGADRIEGTVSFSGITLNPGDNESTYPPGNTSFVADRAPDPLIPAGAPRVCGDLCGAVTAQCEPPFDFPGAAICE